MHAEDKTLTLALVFGGAAAGMLLLAMLVEIWCSKAL